MALPEGMPVNSAQLPACAVGSRHRNQMPLCSARGTGPTSATGPYPALRAWLARVAGEPGHVTMDWRPEAH